MACSSFCCSAIVFVTRQSKCSLMLVKAARFPIVFSFVFLVRFYAVLYYQYLLLCCPYIFWYFASICLPDLIIITRTAQKLRLTIGGKLLLVVVATAFARPLHRACGYPRGLSTGLAFLIVCRCCCRTACRTN